MIEAKRFDQKTILLWWNCRSMRRVRRAYIRWWVRALLWSLLLALIAVPSVSIAEPEPRFDHEQFCIAAQDIERRANADQGTWLDDYTRHEGMTVDCEMRAVELRLYVQVPFKDIPGNWQDRVHREWSDDYCTDPAWAASIAQRWKIVLTIRSIGSEQFSARADCH